MDLVSGRAAQPVNPLGDRSRGRAFGVPCEPFVGSPNSCLMVVPRIALVANLV